MVSGDDVSWRDHYSGGRRPAASPEKAPEGAPPLSNRGNEQAALLKEEGSARGESTDTVEDINDRFRAPSLLFFGASMCILGFVFITAIGLVEFVLEKKSDTLRVPYRSGNGYFPATVSEMVYNQDSPGGRIFHTFGMMSGLCIFLSGYPKHLQNVYTGNAAICGIYWTTVRQLLPAMGLWLLIGVNTYPAPVALQSTGKTKLGCVGLHLSGAGMMFMGYLLCELKCLAVFGLCQSGASKRMHGTERKARKTLAFIIFVTFLAFSLTQVLMAYVKEQATVPDSYWCCADEWKFKGDTVKTAANETLTIMGEPQVVNTASGTFLLLKIFSFVCEDLAGLSLVASHLCIWYFCPERQVDHGKLELMDVEDLTADMYIRQMRRRGIVPSSTECTCCQKCNPSSLEAGNCKS